MNPLKMLDMLTKDNTLEFNVKQPGNDCIVEVGTYKTAANTVMFKTGSCAGEPFIINDYTMKYECTLIPKSVTFMEAVNSGKKVRHDSMAFFHRLDDAVQILSSDYTVGYVREAINGKWYIEPEN